MYPLKMAPYVKETIWGGKNINSKFNKDLNLSKIGESVEVSVHPSGESYVLNGIYKGKTLREALSLIDGSCEFDLMFKIIDAADDLSIQVHPDDCFARAVEGHNLGKTEMWYIMDCKPGSKIGYGLNRDVTESDITEAIENGSLEKYINYIEPVPGKIYFIPAGMIHCLGGGVMVAELQQSSDITYRLYDYNRKDKYGNLRELHVEKALSVLDKSVVKDEPLDKVECEFFSCVPVVCNESYTDSVSDKYGIVFIAEGSGRIISNGTCEEFSAGDTFVLPRNMGEYRIEGDCVFLKCKE